MSRLRHLLLNLGVVLTIASTLTLSGCTSTDQQATEDDVNNNAFTFPSGTVFHPALTGATTLEFTNNANSFTLTSIDNTNNNASGSSFIDPGVASGSCTLIVTNTSFTAGTGPQINDVFTLSPCQFNSANGTLTISNGFVSITSVL